MNLRIRLIDPTGRTDWLKYNANYWLSPESGNRVVGMMFYPGSEFIIQREKKANYEIQIVKQSKYKYKMIGTLFHELTHYIISTVFKNNERLHNWLDRNNE